MVIEKLKINYKSEN